MKKTILLAALAVASLGFSSCESTTDPVLQAPAEGSFILQTPEEASQLITLTKDGSFTVSCNQPDYGMNVQALYELQVSNTENFAQYRTLVPTEGNLRDITVKTGDMDIALCELFGYEDRADFDAKYTGPVTAYVRAYCHIEGVENSGIASNVVTLKEVGLYFAKAEPGCIYIVGNINGWKDPKPENETFYEDWKVMETGIGTGIYTGSFKFTEAPMFRFYSELKDWDFYSIGAQEGEANLDCVFTDNTFSGSAFEAKANWNFPDVTSGNLRVEVNLNTMTVKFTVVADGVEDWDAYNKIFLVGDGVATGWAMDWTKEDLVAKNCCLYDRKGDGVYVSKEPIEIVIDNGYFRFYTEPGDWDNNSFGSQEADSGIAITVPYTGALVKGKGSWCIPTMCKLNMTVDMNAMTVDFQVVE